MAGLLQTIVFVLPLHLIAVSALRCYECADCTVPFSSYYAKQVSCDSSSCMKMNITTKSTRHTQIVSRGCSTYGYEAERCERREVSGTMSEVCYCNDDDCNSSTTIDKTFFPFLMSTSFGLFSVFLRL